MRVRSPTTGWWSCLVPVSWKRTLWAAQRVRNSALWVRFLLTAGGRSGRWCGSQAMTAHDFADLSDVRRATAGKDGGDLQEVARAQQARTDDCKETGVNVAAIAESVDHTARYE